MVLLPVDLRPLLLRRIAPEQEDQRRSHPGVQRVHHGVGELGPAQVFVAERVPLPHRQQRVEQKHPLLSPCCQVPRRVLGEADLFVDVPQARRNRNPLRHAEAQAHGLLRPVVRVLADDHHPDLLQGSELEGREDQGLRGVDGVPLPLHGQLVQQLPLAAEPVTAQLVTNGLLPRVPELPLPGRLEPRVQRQLPRRRRRPRLGLLRQRRRDSRRGRGVLFLL
mmetsp:Transcript_72965/g.194738  ORF Transcript_72965/g.194738 Transcript_72965/m.194738 type:complete len:222 (+) Transcript_72965:229-894(+)